MAEGPNVAEREEHLTSVPRNSLFISTYSPNQGPYLHPIPTLSLVLWFYFFKFGGGRGRGRGGSIAVAESCGKEKHVENRQRNA